MPSFSISTPFPFPQHSCSSFQEGIPDSLCNITDTVCVEPQPKQSNFTDSYTHKITAAILDPSTGVSIAADHVSMVPLN